MRSGQVLQKSKRFIPLDESEGYEGRDEEQTRRRQDLIAAAMRAFPASLKPAFGRNSAQFDVYFGKLPDDMLEGLLSFRMNLAIGKWRSILERISARHGLSINAWHTLFAVSVNGPDDTMTIVAKRINMSNAALVRTLNDLEDAGYIERQVDARDRRAKLLRMTKTGDKVITELFHSINRVRKLLLAGISIEEIELVVEILDRMDANLDDMLASGL